MTTPSHADVQTGALPLPVLTVSRWSRVIALLAAIALIGGVACLQFGSERIPLADVARILLSGGDETLTGAVLAAFRCGFPGPLFHDHSARPDSPGNVLGSGWGVCRKGI